MSISAAILGSGLTTCWEGRSSSQPCSLRFGLSPGSEAVPVSLSPARGQRQARSPADITSRDFPAQRGLQGPPGHRAQGTGHSTFPASSRGVPEEASPEFGAKGAEFDTLPPCPPAPAPGAVPCWLGSHGVLKEFSVTGTQPSSGGTFLLPRVTRNRGGDAAFAP